MLLLAYLLAFSSRGDAGGEGPEVRCELLDPPLRLSGMLSDQGVWLHLLWLSVSMVLLSMALLLWLRLLWLLTRENTPTLTLTLTLTLTFWIHHTTFRYAFQPGIWLHLGCTCYGYPFTMALLTMALFFVWLRLLWLYLPWPTLRLTSTSKVT